jgi:hypothetical protein
MTENITRIVLGFGMIALLASCGPTWEKPGASQQDFEAAQAACEKQAEVKYPPLLHQILRHPAYTTPNRGACFGSPALIDCLQSQSIYVGPQIETVDDNAAPRIQNIQSCLREKGWRPTDGN